MVSYRSIIWILTSSLLLASCGSFDSFEPTPDSAIEETPLPATATPEPIYVEQLRNAEYQLGLTDALRVVQLIDGKFTEGAPGDVDYTSVTMTDFTARGDLNNDGVDEYAVLIAENYSGSGVFVFLVVYSDANGKPVYQTSVLVDDRPQLSELSVKDGEIFLDVTVHAMDDPMCCPALHTARHYHLVDGQLDIKDYYTFTPDGHPRTIKIEAPASGTEVYSFVQIKGTVSIAPFENNLVYRILDQGGVELAIGSITVTAKELGGPGTFNENISLGKILSGALIKLEVRDMSTENNSLFAMDSVELVVK